jgi:phosphatidate cytidylyltransferase
VSNLAARIATAVIGIPLVLAVNYRGGLAFAAVLAATAGWGVWEFCGLLRSAGYLPARWLALPGGVLAAFLPLVSGAPDATFVGVLLLVLCVGGTYSLLPGIGPARLLNWCFTCLPVLYVGVLLGQLAVLRSWHQGAWWVATALLLTWAYDTGAYFSGRTFGRRPFMQHISGKKTVEGVEGGLILSTLAGFVAVPALGLSLWQGPVLGLLCGVAAQAGDLVESMIKRQLNAKDSGSLLPGHGGLLDRIDSLLFTAAITVYAARALGYGA